MTAGVMSRRRHTACTYTIVMPRPVDVRFAVGGGTTRGRTKTICRSRVFDNRYYLDVFCDGLVTAYIYV